MDLIKYIFTIFLMVGFFGIAVLGVYAMHYTNAEEHGCLAALATGYSCADKKDVFSSLTFHLNAFKSFSTAIFGANVFAFLLLFLALVTIFTFTLDQPRELVLSYQKRRFLEKLSLPLQRKFIHWLARHENSPNLA